MALVSVATNSSITLNATTFQTVLAANASRQYVSLCNCDNNDINVFFGTAGSAVDNTGICIPGGESYNFNIINVPYTGEISAKAMKGSPLLFSLEV